WVGIGAYVLLGAAADAVRDDAAHDLLPVSPATPAFAAGGEGGEGGEGGGVPSSYTLNLADESALDYDARPQIETYAKVVHATYRAAHEAALRMKARIDAFLAKPSAETLAEARFAWINARVPYMQTEAFRFYDGPIDVADPE